MTRAAVLGHPIAHSLSPALHNAAYVALGLVGWQYEAIDCGVDELRGRLDSSTTGWVGFSCTMPLKRVALSLADQADPLARAVGAANTLLPRDGGWWAGLTDVAGITAAVREHDVRPASVTILGAGGTAQAALAALADWDLTECHVLVRDSTRTAQLQATAQRLGVRLEVLPLEVTSIALDADLIISTLPRDAADQLASREWQPGQALLDAVYDPWPTVLAEAAQRGGVSVISGALMLLHQAAAQVELMTTRPAPLAAMRAALASAAPGCGV